MAQQRLAITPICEAEDLLLWRHRGRNDRLVVCFSGIAKSRDEVPPYEFPRGATENGKNHVLFVADPRRTWLNGPGLIEKIEAEVARIVAEEGITSVSTMGHSMGGFAAIVMAKFMPVENALAFAPQHSVHPEIAGNEHRWKDHLARITEFRVRSVDDYWVDGTTYFVFHGDHPRDQYQRGRFPVRHKLFHTILPDTTHAVPQKLKQAGLLDRVVSLCLAGKGRKVREVLEPMGAHRRTLEDYPLLGPSPAVAA